MKFKSFRPKFGKKKEENITNVIPSNEGIQKTDILNPNNNSQLDPRVGGDDRPQLVSHQQSIQPQQNPKNTLRLTPLGGVGLVQKNMFVYEYGDDIVIIDCGVGFPDDGMPGVDLIIPDISYLKDKK